MEGRGGIDIYIYIEREREQEECNLPGAETVSIWCRDRERERKKKREECDLPGAETMGNSAT